MKNIFFICMFGLLAFAGCSDNEEEILTGGNIDIDMLPPNQPNDVIDEKLFAVINLDYPGLEKAKEFYNSGKYYYAVNELLEYYRNRTSVINPNIQLMNTPITASELNSRPLKSAHLRNIVRKQYPADFFNKPQKSPHGSFEVVCGGS